VRTVLTDNGTHFTNLVGETWFPPKIKQVIVNRQLFRTHAFEYGCVLNDINDPLTKPKHPSMGRLNDKGRYLQTRLLGDAR
jgi:hypothetical protein